MKRIFTYWENPRGGAMPPYLGMCMETWTKNIPGADVTVVNPGNLGEWLDPGYVTYGDLKPLSLAQRKDVVMYGLVYKHGGVFLDADTIAVRDISGGLDNMDRDKLYFFGNPKTKGVHCSAAICAGPGHAAALEMMDGAKRAIAASGKPFSKEALYKLARNAAANVRNVMNGEKPRFEGYMPWDYFGNRVIHAVMSGRLADSIGIIDRVKSGGILEASYQKGSNKESYIGLYFTPNGVSVDDALSKAPFGLINLHNSWTPREYKAYSRERIMGDGLFISRLLRRTMGMTEPGV